MRPASTGRRSFGRSAKPTASGLWARYAELDEAGPCFGPGRLVAAGDLRLRTPGRAVVAESAVVFVGARGGGAPGLGGALEQGVGDVDDDRLCGVVGELVLELGGMVEQAGAGGGRVWAPGRDHVLREAFVASGASVQV